MIFTIIMYLILTIPASTLVGWAGHQSNVWKQPAERCNGCLVAEVDDFKKIADISIMMRVYNWCGIKATSSARRIVRRTSKQ